MKFGMTRKYKKNKIKINKKIQLLKKLDKFKNI